MTDMSACCKSFQVVITFQNDLNNGYLPENEEQPDGNNTPFFTVNVVFNPVKHSLPPHSEVNADRMPLKRPALEKMSSN
jgi:hypothetical protein